MTAPDPQTAALLAQMWERFRPLAQERLAALDRLVTALPAPSDDVRADAAAAAHKLAGSLGTYGRAGSDDARSLELLLKRGGDLAEVPALVRRLHDAAR